MDKRLHAIAREYEKQFAAQTEEEHNEVRLIVPVENIVTACKQLHDRHGFELLSAMTAVDYWPQDAPRFHIIYQFNSLSQNLSLGLRVPVAGSDPAVPTIAHIYRNANWREREIWDMFGIRFIGHPDLRRILMPEDWEGHPLRKDYPLGYEEPQFSFNFEDIRNRKPRARE